MHVCKVDSFCYLIIEPFFKIKKKKQNKTKKNVRFPGQEWHIN